MAESAARMADDRAIELQSIQRSHTAETEAITKEYAIISAANEALTAQVVDQAETIVYLTTQLTEEQNKHAQLQQLTALQSRAIEQLQAVELLNHGNAELAGSGSAAGEVALLRDRLAKMKEKLAAQTESESTCAELQQELTRAAAQHAELQASMTSELSDAQAEVAHLAQELSDAHELIDQLAAEKQIWLGCQSELEETRTRLSALQACTRRDDEQLHQATEQWQAERSTLHSELSEAKAALAARSNMVDDELEVAYSSLVAARQDNRLLMSALSDTECRADDAEELSERRAADLIGLADENMKVAEVQGHSIRVANRFLSASSSLSMHSQALERVDTLTAQLTEANSRISQLESHEAQEGLHGYSAAESDSEGEGPILTVSSGPILTEIKPASHRRTSSAELPALSPRGKPGRKCGKAVCASWKRDRMCTTFASKGVCEFDHPPRHDVQPAEVLARPIRRHRDAIKKNRC